MFLVLILVSALFWPMGLQAQSLESRVDLYAVDYFLVGDESGFTTVNIDELIIVNFPNEIPNDATFEHRITPAIPGSRLVENSISITDEQDQSVNFDYSSNRDRITVSIPVPNDTEATAVNYKISYRLDSLQGTVQENGAVLQFRTGGLSQTADLVLAQVHVPSAQLDILEDYQSCSVTGSPNPCSVDTREQVDGRALIYSVSGLNAEAEMQFELNFSSGVLATDESNSGIGYWAVGLLAIVVGSGYWFANYKSGSKKKRS